MCCSYFQGQANDASYHCIEKKQRTHKMLREKNENKIDEHTCIYIFPLDLLLSLRTENIFPTK